MNGWGFYGVESNGWPLWREQQRLYCKHEWVNISFFRAMFVCKKCNSEMDPETGRVREPNDNEGNGNA